MIDKALVVIMAAYALSLTVVAVQVEAEANDYVITNLAGQPIESTIIGFLNMDQYNNVTANIVNGTFNQNTTYYNRVETFTTAAAAVAWELVTLLSGTYIFNFMFLFGVPYAFVAIFVILHLFLLARAVIGYVRGV